MSPFCNKTRRCLRQKGLAFEVIDYNGLEARKAAKLSPVGTLPVLDYEGERVADSARIARFLDRMHPDRPLYPKEPQDLASARFWEDWAGASLYFYEIYFRMLHPPSLEKALDVISKGRPRFERGLLKLAFKQRYPKKLGWQGLGRLAPEDVEAKFNEHLDGIEILVAKTGFLVGRDANIADLSVAAQLDEMTRTSKVSETILSRPKIADWMRRLPAG
jgi:glutathione S-transferase